MTRYSRNVAVALLLVSFVVLSGCALTNAGNDGAAGRQGSTSGSAEQRRVDIRMQLAIGYYEQGQYQVALSEIEQVVRQAPGYVDAYSMRGLIYMGLGDRKLAEQSFVQALKLSPHHPDVANNYALLLCDSGRQDEAMRYFNMALSNTMYRTPAVAAGNAGSCLWKQKRRNEAAVYFRQALQYDPANPLANVQLADWYLEQKDLERARFHMKFVENNTLLGADTLWLAIKVERRLGNREAERLLADQLGKRYPVSPEYVAYQRGAFDE